MKDLADRFFPKEKMVYGVSLQYTNISETFFRCHVFPA